MLPTLYNMIKPVTKYIINKFRNNFWGIAYFKTFCHILILTSETTGSLLISFLNVNQLFSITGFNCVQMVFFTQKVLGSAIVNISK